MNESSDSDARAGGMAASARDPSRRILHLDMDAFFASVELLRRPALAGLPVVIGGRGDPSRRGVVSTCTYEARKFGIHSAMPLRTAFERCPHAVFLPVDFAEYRRLSAMFKDVMRAASPVMEDRGIDEAYLDISALPDDAATVGGRIKAGIRAATGLSCSIGIAPNKVLAKMASELDKPDGLTIIAPGDLERRIWPLGVRKVPGIGPKAEEKLASLRIHTVGELAATPLDRLYEWFGPSYAGFLYQAARGIDDRPVVTHREPKTRSRETTFQQDTREWQVIARTLAALSEEVSEDLRSEGYAGRTVGIKLRFADFRTHTREKTLDAPTDTPTAIRKAAFECLARIALDRRVRLLGVRVGDLVRST